MAQGSISNSLSQPVYLTDLDGNFVAVQGGNGATTAIPSSSTLATKQVDVAITATQIVAARTGRNAITVTNKTGAQQVYVGPTSAVTAATGQLLPAGVGASITLPYTGALFGIAVSATQTVTVAETY